MTALDHVTITARDFPASLACYEAALTALGYLRLDELVDEEEDEAEVEAAAWGSPDGDAVLWLVHGDPPTSGLHVCLKTESRSQVETFFMAAVQAGARPHAAPRRWTPYRRGRVSAFVADPAGNLLEASAPE